MVSATKISVEAEFQQRRNTGFINSGNLSDISREFARRRIVLAAKSANHAYVPLTGFVGNALRKYTHTLPILTRALVSTNNVIVQHGLDVPASFLGHFSEVLAAVESLLLTSDGEKNDRRGELQFAQNARALETNDGTARVVLAPGCSAWALV